MARARSPKPSPAANPKPTPVPQIQSWPIDQVKPYPQNPRKISEAAELKVATSIKEFGFQQPIVVDAAGVIIVGHTRLRAAKLLKLTHVPVVVADLDETKARAYRIADNRTNEEAEWIGELLGTELSALAAASFDLTTTGLSAKEIEGLLAPEPDGDPGEDEPAEGEADAGETQRCECPSCGHAFAITLKLKKSKRKRS